MSAGMILYTVVSLGFLLSNDIALFVLLRAVQGAASAMVWPVAEAYLADATKRWQRGKAISFYTASMLFAELVGPGVGVAVYKGWVAAFGGADYLMALKSPIIFLVVMAFGSLLTFGFLPEIKAGGNPRLQTGFLKIRSVLRSLPREISTSLKTIYFNGVVNGFALGIVETALVVYIIELVAKDPAYLGIFYMLFSAVALPATLFSGYITDRLKRRRPIIILGFIIGRAVFFIFPLIRDPILLLALAIPASMVFGISMPAMRALQADITPQEVRGTVFGLQQFFMNGGVFAGAILGGWLTQILATQTYQIAAQQIQGIALPFWIAGTLGAITVSYTHLTLPTTERV